MSLGREKTRTPKSASPSKSAAKKTSVERNSERCDFVNMLTKADREWQADILQTISELKTLKQCKEFLVKLELATADGDVDLFDRGLGVKSWLLGAIFTQIKPLPKKDEHGKPVHRSRLPLPNRNGKRMTLAQYVQEFLPFSVTTVHWCRKIYDVFKLEEARVLGYREMISQLAPSFRKALDDGPPNTPNDAEDEGEDGSGSSPASPGDANTNPANGDDGADGGTKTKVAPLAITDIPKKLTDISELLDRMLAVPKSPNRYNNVDRHLKVLSDQQTIIDALNVKLVALPAALEQTRLDIKHWHDQGIKASHGKAVGRQADEGDGRSS